jgi:hypothetical protein
VNDKKGRSGKSGPKSREEMPKKGAARMRIALRCINPLCTAWFQEWCRAIQGPTDPAREIGGHRRAGPMGVPWEDNLCCDAQPSPSKP